MPGGLKGEPPVKAEYQRRVFPAEPGVADKVMAPEPHTLAFTSPVGAVGIALTVIVTGVRLADWHDVPDLKVLA